MSFASVTFLIIFMPLCLIPAAFLKKDYRNYFLFLVSAFFYMWCGLKFLVLVLISSTVIYFAGIAIEKAEGHLKSIVLMITLAYCLGVLFFFKYFLIMLPGLSRLLAGVIGVEAEAIESIGLPLGMSYYTFSMISYVVDVYWREAKAQRNIFLLYLYILFFPKIIQGPVMRYTDFEEQMEKDEADLSSLNDGMERFIKGLVKKVLIADQITPIVSYSFSDISKIGTIPAWLGMIAYVIELYYDFSGYSDIALGMGQMVGFKLSENFDHPMMAASMSEFWRRWHISFGHWLRQYIYTPLFKILVDKHIVKRKDKASMLYGDIFAMMIVWILNGLWHGWSLKFLFVGLGFWFFVAVERVKNYILKQKGASGRMWKLFDRLWFLVGWISMLIIFRSNSVGDALEYFRRMFVWSKTDGILFLHQYDNYIVTALIVGLIFLFPIYGWLKEKIIERRIWSSAIYRVALVGVFVVVFSYMISTGTATFLYAVY